MKQTRDQLQRRVTLRIDREGAARKPSAAGLAADSGCFSARHAKSCEEGGDPWSLGWGPVRSVRHAVSLEFDKFTSGAVPIVLDLSVPLRAGFPLTSGK